MKPTYNDWIALYKCSSKRNLEEFVAVETDLTICSPTKHGLNPVIFYANQLKNVKCNVDYEFLYGNKFNEVFNYCRFFPKKYISEILYFYRFVELVVPYDLFIKMIACFAIQKMFP